MSLPRENVLFVPSRNVLLTRSGWEGAGTRNPHHDTTDRDRLVVLRKAQKKLIRQHQAAKELEISARQVRRPLGKLREQGDTAVIHGLRGRPSNRRVS
jgi:biotin operon repressor